MSLPSDPVTCFLIQYVGLGSLFLIALGLAYRMRQVGLRSPMQRRNLFWMVFGYVFYASLHGVFIFGLAHVGER